MAKVQRRSADHFVGGPLFNPREGLRDKKRFRDFLQNHEPQHKGGRTAHHLQRLGLGCCVSEVNILFKYH